MLVRFYVVVDGYNEYDIHSSNVLGYDCKIVNQHRANLFLMSHTFDCYFIRNTSSYRANRYLGTGPPQAMRTALRTISVPKRNSVTAYCYWCGQDCHRNVTTVLEFGAQYTNINRNE